MKRSSTTHPSLLVMLLLAPGTSAWGQFKPVGPAPYTATVARQKIGALLAKTDPANRQQSIATISGLLTWYRDIADDELIAAWKKDEGRANLPEAIIALADARVATAVVEFSWRQRREAAFQPAYAPMLGNLMLRFPESAKTFLDDLLGDPHGPTLPLAEPQAYAVCRILLDMPDIGSWRTNAGQILPRYREAAETLIAEDASQGGPEQRGRAQYWMAVLRPSAPDAGGRSLSPRPSEATSGTLECNGGPIAPNAEFVFRNVTTENRRFEFDRKTWDIRLAPGQAGTQNMILTNKSSRPQKGCIVKWSMIP
jgi:hypothetical protein